MQFSPFSFTSFSLHHFSPRRPLPHDHSIFNNIYPCQDKMYLVDHELEAGGDETHGSEGRHVEFNLCTINSISSLWLFANSSPIARGQTDNFPKVLNPNGLFPKGKISHIYYTYSGSGPKQIKTQINRADLNDSRWLLVQENFFYKMMGQKYRPFSDRYLVKKSRGVRNI